MELLLAICAGLWYWIARTQVGYTLHAILCQPLVMALPFGIIAGDLPQAMIIASGIQMVYLGLVGNGGNLPADECLAGCIAIPIALLTNMDPGQAVVLAMPFGLIGVLQDQIRRIINAVFIHRADKMAEIGNVREIGRCATLYPVILGFFLRFPIVFLITYAGADAVQSVLAAMPLWITHGLSVAGGVLPAMGFAMTVYIIGKKQYLPFFIIAFFLVQYLNINVMAAAIFGTCVALLIVFLRREQIENQMKA